MALADAAIQSSRIGAAKTPLLEDDIHGDLHFGDERPELARRLEISIMPRTLFSNGERYRSSLRLSAGHPWNQRTEQAIATLGRLAGALPPTQSSP